MASWGLLPDFLVTCHPGAQRRIFKLLISSCGKLERKFSRGNIPGKCSRREIAPFFVLSRSSEEPSARPLTVKNVLLVN